MFVILVSLSLSLVLIHGQSDPFSYASNGADWTGNCPSGVAQSPIDITDYTSVGSSDAGYAPIPFTWKPLTTYSVTDSGHLYEVIGDWGSFKYGNLSYASGIYHFHAPSEHYLDGVQYPVELHLGYVHPSGFNVGGFLVLVVLFEEGDESPALANLMSSSPTAIDVSSIFDGASSLDNYYFYTGSGTTPPCFANVPWFIYGKIQQASAAQIDFFNKRWKNNPAFAGGKGNNRAQQSRGSRTVIHYDDAAEVLGAVGAFLLLSW